jgi:hypothetical protein
MPKARAPDAPCVEGVAVAADDGDAGLCQALLRPHHMDDALARVAQAEHGNAVFNSVSFDRLHHSPRFGLVDRRDIAARGRDVMVGRPEGAVRPAQLQAFSSSTSKAWRDPSWM